MTRMTMVTIPLLVEAVDRGGPPYTASLNPFTLSRRQGRRTRL
jgi:hypothetical protein